ncbi:hypothetical protein [Brevundimonas sp.]|jgi:hypothetical protein|uniref:hypothetical protein n=1 Tax=Brevundimonas sp. TaxID=1871086 RepID=UPI00378386F6
MRIGPKPRLATPRLVRAGVVAALLAAQASGAMAQATAPTAAPTGPYYDRAFMLAADQKCRLFQPMVARALTSATLQARGAAVRHGATADDLAATAGRASAKANATACDNPDLVRVRGRVATAFAGWAQTPRMTFPGAKADWAADRYGLVQAGWRLKQSVTTGQAPVTFGLVGDAGQGETLAAVVSFVGHSRPYAARIVLRDADRSSRPWLPGRAGDLPPESLRLAVFSAGSSEAAPGLLEPTRKDGQAWRFPDAAADLIAALDPREVFAVEFLFRDDSIARATFEAGDFAAGRAFVDMGSL